MNATLRRIGGILCLALTAYFLLPATMGILHWGMIWPSVLLHILAIMLLRPHRPDRVRRHRTLCRVLNGCLCLVLSAIAAVFVLMGLRAADRPSPQGEITVIVLGCQVNGTEPMGASSFIIMVLTWRR